MSDDQNAPMQTATVSEDWEQAMRDENAARLDYDKRTTALGYAVQVAGLNSHSAGAFITDDAAVRTAAAFFAFLSASTSSGEQAAPGQGASE